MIDDRSGEQAGAEPAHLVMAVASVEAPLPPLGPCRVHPAWIAIGAVGWLRSLGVPFLIALLTGGSRYSQIFYAVATVLAVVVAIVRIAQWTRLRYEVSGGELRVTSGLFSRQERLVPLERIQAVDINETLLQRIFGVVGVKIETAAGGMARTDVNLEALRRADALALRDRLALARPRAGTGAAGHEAGEAVSVPAGDRSQLIRAITPREVAIAGATSARIGPAAALVVTGLELFDAVLGRTFGDVFGVEPGASPSGIALLVMLLAVGGWVLAMGSAVLLYSGFQLRRDGDRLLIHHGLLDRRRRTIPIARIQAIRISEGLLRQPFGLVAVQFDSAAYGRSAADSGILFPLLPRSQVADLLMAACPALAIAPGMTSLERPPERARRRYMLRPAWGVAIAGAVATGLAALVSWAPWWWGALTIALLPIAALLGLWQFRDAGWAFDRDERLIVRGRTLGRSTAIARRHRVQHYSVHRGLFQRRARLASFGAAIASGGQGRVISIADLDEGVAFGIAREINRPSRPPR